MLNVRRGIESLEDSLDVLVPLELGTDILASAEDAHLDLVRRGVGFSRIGSEGELHRVLAVKVVDGLFGNQGEQISFTWLRPLSLAILLAALACPSGMVGVWFWLLKAKLWFDIKMHYALS